MNMTMLQTIQKRIDALAQKRGKGSAPVYYEIHDAYGNVIRVLATRNGGVATPARLVIGGINLNDI